MDWLQPEVLISIAGGIVGFIIWLIRLEGKFIGGNREISLLKEMHSSLSADLDSVRNKQELIDDKLAIELKEINIKLAQIEGYLLRTKSAAKR